MVIAFFSEHTLSLLKRCFCAIVVASMAFSCASVKNPPVGKPFIYDTKVNVVADGLNGEDRNLMQEKLLTFLDDSLKVGTKMIFGKTQRVNPPVFDSANITRSMVYMNGYLNSLGYYNARFDTFFVKTDQKPELKQERVFITFLVNLGKSLRVDTLIYTFNKNAAGDSLSMADLQALADSAYKNTTLPKNALYAKDKVAAELDRIAAIFRTKGYLKINRSVLLAVADTIDPTLISIDADPIAQVLSAQKRKEDPRISLEIYARPGVDSTYFQKFLIDTVKFYPETKVNEEPAVLMKDTTLQSNSDSLRFQIKYRANLFSQKLLRKNNFITPGNYYNENRYFRTINGLAQMGPWEQVEVVTTLRNDSVPKVNFDVFLFPAKKQSFQVDLEASQNNNISSGNLLSGRFLALSLNATHRNRNAFKTGIQSTTIGRVGFELNTLRQNSNSDFFQTFLVSFNQSYSLPKMVWPFRFLEQGKGVDLARTNINAGILYTQRFNFFTQTSFNTSLQWERRKGRNFLSFSFPNLESVFITTTDSLNKAIANNPSLLLSFTPGNILSMKGTFERTLDFKRRPRHTGLFRLGAELTMPEFFSIFGQGFFQFLRLEAQFIHNVQVNKGSWHFRGFGGVGWNLKGGLAPTLPFFRQFVAGGNNSMRGWGLRQLGLGNSIVSDTFYFTDRFGDIQLEANAEYRFKLFRLFGFGMEGTAFTDIGNIWNHKATLDGNGKFVLANFYRDLAIAVGTGIRWDLSYLIIRLDTGFKLKDPVREGAGWIKDWGWKSTNRLGYPERSNVSFQFGIGYPF